VLTAPRNEDIELQVKDITKRMLKAEKISAVNGSSTIVIPVVSNMQRGTYILQRRSSSGIISKVIQKR